MLRIYNCNFGQLLFGFLFFVGISPALALEFADQKFSDQSGSIEIRNNTDNVVTVSSVSSVSSDSNLVTVGQCGCGLKGCEKNNDGSYTLEAQVSKGKPENRFTATLSCPYDVLYTPTEDENVVIEVDASSGLETTTIFVAGENTGGNGGTLACVGDEIGFTGTLKSFNGEGSSTKDYLVFRLDEPAVGGPWSGNYIHSVSLHTTRDGDTAASQAAVNLLFGGQQFNGWSGGELTLGGARMPKNSLALVTAQTGTNTRGVNVQFPTVWDAENWLLCGTQGDDSSYDVWDGLPANDSVNNVSTLGGGVNVMGGEYACAQGWGFHHHSAVGVSHSQLTEMLLDWGANTVRLPMNEHCWVSGLSDYGTGLNTGPYAYIQTNNNKSSKRSNFRAELLASPENCNSDNSHCDDNQRVYSVCNGTTTDDGNDPGADVVQCSTQGAGYRESFRDLVNQLTTAGINVVLDLHWTDNNGDGSGTALDLTILPGELSKVFWRSVAEEFKGLADPTTGGKVMYNLFNEPKGIPGDADLWVRWRDGDDTYTGMQELVNVVRGDLDNGDPLDWDGATNDIVIGGLDYGGDLRGWLTHAPFDSEKRLWADSHSYPTGDYKCWADDSKEQDGYACWNRTMLPIVNEGFGAMFGEAGNSISRGGCGGDKLKYLYQWVTEGGKSGLDEQVVSVKNIPVLQWAFLPGGASNESNSPSSNSCRIPSVITRWPGKTGEEGTGFLAAGEADKDTRDITPSVNTDDATWAGCLNWAYLNNKDVDDWTDPQYDSDPVYPNQNGVSVYGNCLYFDQSQ